MIHDDKPPLDEDLLMHFGVKGMKWGTRKADLPGVSRKTNKEAKGDAQEFARAKLFYGEGAGTRRKLIKAKVESKSKQDPNYKKAFDHHFSQQDLGSHAEKARSERRRKDTRASVGKNARAVNRAVNGPFAAPVAVGLVTAGAAYAQRSGLDRKVMSQVRTFMNNQALRREVNDLLRNR